MPATATTATATTRSVLGVEPGQSWLSLLASSSLGVPRLATVSVEVSLGQTRLNAGSYRLVVQSYAASNVKGAKPLGSVVRTVTTAELRRGVRVSLVELSAAGVDEPYVVAWIEAVEANIELDGRRARPREGSLMAMARATRGKNPVCLVLG